MNRCNDGKWGKIALVVCMYACIRAKFSCIYTSENAMNKMKERRKRYETFNSCKVDIKYIFSIHPVFVVVAVVATV